MWFWIFGAVLLFLLILFLLFPYLCYRITFTIRGKDSVDPEVFPKGMQYDGDRQEMLEMIRAAVALPCEEVWTESPDGLRLHARYYETAPGAPLQILVHGYHGHPLRDFSGGLFLSLESGWNALVIDQRGHGSSEGKCLTFGIKERFDLLSWVNYARERFGKDVPIVLTGISMGAATVMMASALDLPENVKGIIADCGYTSPKAVISHVIRRLKLPSFAYFFLKLGAKLYGRFDLEEESATRALTEAKVPVLFIHGEADNFVPCEMSRENYAACTSKKTLFTVPGASHGLSYMIDNEGYRAAVQTFLEEVTEK